MQTKALFLHFLRRVFPRGPSCLFSCFPFKFTLHAQSIRINGQFKSTLCASRYNNFYLVPRASRHQSPRETLGRERIIFCHQRISPRLGVRILIKVREADRKRRRAKDNEKFARRLAEGSNVLLRAPAEY